MYKDLTDACRQLRVQLHEYMKATNSREFLGIEGEEQQSEAECLAEVALYNVEKLSAVLIERLGKTGPKWIRNIGPVRDLETVLREQGVYGVDTGSIRTLAALGVSCLEQLEDTIEVEEESLRAPRLELKPSAPHVKIPEAIARSTTAREVLLEMLSENMTGPESARSRDEIIALVHGIGSRGDNQKDIFARLKRSGCTDAAPRVGTWLTSRGIEVAKALESIKNPRNT